MNFTHFDTSFLRNTFDIDYFDWYPSGSLLSGFAGGIGWAGAFCDKSGIAYPALVSFDDFQSYSNGTALLGLNLGTGWGGSFYDK